MSSSVLYFDVVWFVVFWRFHGLYVVVRGYVF